MVGLTVQILLSGVWEWFAGTRGMITGTLNKMYMVLKAVR